MSAQQTAHTSGLGRNRGGEHGQPIRGLEGRGLEATGRHIETRGTITRPCCVSLRLQCVGLIPDHTGG